MDIDISKGKYWDRAWSLVQGCTPVSEACDNCWLKDISNRFGSKNFNDVGTRSDRLDIPLKRKKPTVYAVWSDLFHNNIWDEFISVAFEEMILCPQHTFLILTKRPVRMMEFMERPVMRRSVSLMPNVWLGVTAENQTEADRRIPILLQTPAAKRFISIEPCLGDIIFHAGWLITKAFDWVIVGAESGSKRRECRLEWVRFIVQQCQAANIPVFVKQLNIGGKLINDFLHFPPDLRVRELPWQIKE